MRRLGRRAIAAVEFAVLAPIALVILFGTIEATFAFRMQAKLQTAAGALAEMVAGSGTVTAPNGTLKDLCNGAKLNLIPFASDIFTANVVSITNDVPANRISGSTDTTTVTTYLDWENVSDCGQDAGSANAPALGLSGAKAIADTGRSLLTQTGAPSSSGAGLSQGYSAIVVKVNYNYGLTKAKIFTTKIPLVTTAAVKPRTYATTPCTSPSNSALCPALQ